MLTCVITFESRPLYPLVTLCYALNMKVSFKAGLVVIVKIETLSFAQNRTSVRRSSSLESLHSLSYVVKYRLLKILHFPRLP
jgi:hypothetical protein